MNCHGLFATNVIPKLCGTNVSHNLYNKQIRLSFSIKNCIISRDVKTCLFFHSIMFNFIKIKTTDLYRFILLRIFQIIDRGNNSNNR